MAHHGGCPSTHRDRSLKRKENAHASDHLDEIWKLLNALEDIHQRLWHAFESQLIERYIMLESDVLPIAEDDEPFDEDDIPF